MSVRNRRNAEPDIEALLIQYRNMGGIPFSGEESIMKTHAWIRSAENIFDGLKLRDDQKRLLAS